MRLIGYLPDEQTAATFSDFLYVHGITNQVEAEKDRWAVWIHSEDELEQARQWLQSYVAAPNDPKYRQHAREARRLKEREQQETVEAEARFFDRSRLLRATVPYGVGRLTFGLIVLSAGLTQYLWFSNDSRIEHLLQITPYEIVGGYLVWTKGLPEICHGEVWRLITPVFPHATMLHLFFNLLWLFDLGSMIEGRQGARRLAALALVIAALSNLGQYWLKGPAFMGMSGVVYGLLGYIWMKGRFDPASGLFLHPQTVAMMLIWFFLCLAGVVGNIANGAHAVGLAVGIAWGCSGRLFK